VATTDPPISNLRIFSAETVGTAVLVLGGPGSALLAGQQIGLLGVSLAFGLSLLIMAYAIGPISGCHINPAVTLAMVLTRKVEIAKAAYYWVAQLLGAAIGGGILLAIASGVDGFEVGESFRAVSNGWGDDVAGGYSLASAAIVEIVFTAMLVAVVLATTTRRFRPGMGGLAAGMTLALIHLVTIPIDNTSVNPARSFATAIYGGGDALTQLWAFVVFPMVGAVVGVLIHLLVHDDSLEDTMFDSGGARRMRQMGEDAAHKVESTLDR
jgi:aquaporin Z